MEVEYRWYWDINSSLYKKL